MGMRVFTRFVCVVRLQSPPLNMPPTRSKRVADSSKEDRVLLAKAEWEQGLWSSQRAAANAHDVSTFSFFSYSLIVNPCSRSLVGH